MRRILSAPVSWILLLSLGMLPSLNEATASTDCDKQALIPLEAPIEGTATLCVKAEGGVRVRVKARQLTSGNAYTLWFAYIDNPSLCSGGPGVCGPVDFGAGDPEANPLGVFGRLDSTVADENGKEDFSGRVGGLRLSSGSQVWLILYSHGPAVTDDNRSRARQLLTPEDPDAGMPGLGNVVDGPGFSPNAIAIFEIP